MVEDKIKHQIGELVVGMIMLTEKFEESQKKIAELEERIRNGNPVADIPLDARKNAPLLNSDVLHTRPVGKAVDGRAHQ